MGFIECSISDVILVFGNTRMRTFCGVSNLGIEGLLNESTARKVA